MEEQQTAIYCYVSPAGNNKIADWYSKLSIQSQADADKFIGDMMKTKDWSPPNYKPLMDGLGELRWFSEDKQHRLLGFFKDKRWYAVIGCTHKQRIYSPADSLETAKKYKRQIEKKEATTVIYDL